MEDNIPSDTSKVEGIAGNRTCPKCGQAKQWRNREWVCLEHDNKVPADWKHPQSGGLVVKGDISDEEFKKGGAGSIQIVREEGTKVNEIQKSNKQIKENIDLIKVPQQAREIFQKLVWNTLEVRLSKVQSENFLNLLEQMETPTKMTDAKAIIKLIEQLEKIKGE